MDRSKDRIVFVEFIDDDGVMRPHSIGFSAQAGQRPRCDWYDVDWCRRDGCYYSHMSGCGFEPYSSGMYWAAEGVIVEEREGAHRLPKLPRQWGIKRLMEKAFEHGEEMETAWCEVCQDCIPIDSNSDMCHHLAWAVEIGVCGCGCVDVPYNTVRDDFVALFKHLGIPIVRRLIELLRRDAYKFEFKSCEDSIEQAHQVCDPEDDLKVYFEAVISGFNGRDEFPLSIVVACLWLETLEAGVTREPAARVIHYAEEWLREYDDEEIEKWARWHVYRSFFRETGSYRGACCFA